MARLFIFADEAGCFNFSRRPGASKYYIVCTISCRACAALGASLLDLRRQLIWEKAPIGEFFHASEDKQMIRDRVLAALQKHDFSIHATILEKSKAFPRIRPTNHRFYQYGWFYHFKHAAPKIVQGITELHITTASVGTSKGQAALVRPSMTWCNRCWVGAEPIERIFAGLLPIHVYKLPITAHGQSRKNGRRKIFAPTI